MLTEQETSSLCFDLRETHIDRAKFDRAESLRRREKQNQASLVYYSIVSSSLLKGESKLCYFPKIYSNTNTSETLHLQDLTRTGASLSLLRTSWTSKRSCLSLPWIKINTTRNLVEFYDVSFARSIVSSRNSRSCFCNRLLKTAAANSLVASLYVHILWAQKSIQELAASKITQQKGSMNY